jgi:hypothetical protein
MFVAHSGGVAVGGCISVESVVAACWGFGRVFAGIRSAAACLDAGHEVAQFFALMGTPAASQASLLDSLAAGWVVACAGCVFGRSRTTDCRFGSTSQRQTSAHSLLEFWCISSRLWHASLRYWGGLQMLDHWRGWRLHERRHSAGHSPSHWLRWFLVADGLLEIGPASAGGA